MVFGSIEAIVKLNWISVDPLKVTNTYWIGNSTMSGLNSDNAQPTTLISQVHFTGICTDTHHLK